MEGPIQFLPPYKTLQTHVFLSRHYYVQILGEKWSTLLTLNVH